MKAFFFQAEKFQLTWHENFTSRTEAKAAPWETSTGGDGLAGLAQAVARSQKVKPRHGWGIRGLYPA